MALIAFSGPIFNSFSCSSVPNWAVFWKIRCGTNSRINLGWLENHLGLKESKSKNVILLDQKMGQFLFVPKSLKSCNLDTFWTCDLQRYSNFCIGISFDMAYVLRPRISIFCDF